VRRVIRAGRIQLLRPATRAVRQVVMFSRRQSRIIHDSYCCGVIEGRFPQSAVPRDEVFVNTPGERTTVYSALSAAPARGSCGV